MDQPSRSRHRSRSRSPTGSRSHSHSHRHRDRDRDRDGLRDRGDRSSRRRHDDERRSSRRYDEDRSRSSSRRHDEERHTSSSRRYDEGRSASGPTSRLGRQESAEQSRSSSQRRSPSPPAADAADDGPNFAPSGLLAAESNNKDGVALKYHEPGEARKPKRPWRLYVFKDGKEVDMITLGAQSAYLLGRDRIVVDIPLDHPSCSKQHAVIQFRQTVQQNEFGDQKRKTKPFLIDLESSNGSAVNKEEIPPSRYYEIKNGDTITFGASTPEYVMLDEGAV